MTSLVQSIHMYSPQKIVFSGAKPQVRPCLKFQITCKGALRVSRNTIVIPSAVNAFNFFVKRKS